VLQPQQTALLLVVVGVVAEVAGVAEAEGEGVVGLLHMLFPHLLLLSLLILNLLSPHHMDHDQRVLVLQR
jgi:hypothetical protein